MTSPGRTTSAAGGGPRAVAEYQRTGAVGRPDQRDLLAWLRADVDPDAPLESVPQLQATLMERMTSPLALPTPAG